MRLLSYYALHSLKNQIKKMFKTWVFVLLAVCVIVGGVGGLIAGFVADEDDENTEQSEIADPGEEMEFEIEFEIDAETGEIIELVAGGVILAIFVAMAFGADKNGSRIFLPADVNLLFSSPMSPQSILIFRVITQLGVAILGSFYLIFQVPNLAMNFGLDIWSIIVLIAVWCFTVALATLVKVMLYSLSSAYPGVKRFMRPGIYALLLIVTASYLLYSEYIGGSRISTLVKFFCSDFSRYIPVWGWLKGMLMYTIEGNPAGAVLSFVGVIAAGAAMLYVIYHTKVDFYEDAMIKSEEVARVVEAVQSEKSSRIAVKRKKDRSQKLRRDGLWGFGANVFFCKTLYNRFRFARLGIFTKTMELYLAAAVAIGALCRISVGTSSIVPLALAIAGFSFFRALGNPLEEDTSMDQFILIPESTHTKLFWSFLGGTVNCVLDVLPAIIIGAAIIGANPVSAMVWIPFIASVDFYSTSVGAFINLSVPVNAGKIVKNLVQVLFVYFGLVPDVLIFGICLSFDGVSAGAVISAVFNILIGLVFFALLPLFIEPKVTYPKTNKSLSDSDFHAARRVFSRLGAGAFVILVLSSALQIAAAVIIDAAYGENTVPEWLAWVCTFAPMYAVGVPVGLLIINKMPSVPPVKRNLKFSQIISSAVICIFMMYAGNIAGIAVMSLLGSLSGRQSVNPVESYVTGNALWIRVLVMVILAPIIEEYIFRRKLINRMNIYGEKTAVVTSAFMFGLIHGNLSQFFYAFALGLLFGYLYLKTGRLRYSVGLHMFVNFLGSVVGPYLIGRVDLASFDESYSSDPLAIAGSPEILWLGAYVFAMIALAVVGLVMFCIKSRNVRFYTADLELPRGTVLKTVYMNPGMLLLIVSCALFIALAFVI